MSVGLCQSAAKGKEKGWKKQNILMKVTKIGFLGVSFCVFCFFGFLVFWFVVVFFEGLAKQHKSEGPRPHSLPVLPLFGVANLLLVDFIGCFGPVVPLENHVKKTWQNAGITGGSLGGLGHRLGNFVCLYNFSKNCVEQMQPMNV